MKHYAASILYFAEWFGTIYNNIISIFPRKVKRGWQEIRKKSTSDLSRELDRKNEGLIPRAVSAPRCMRFTAQDGEAAAPHLICSRRSTRLTPSRMCPIPAIPEIAASVPLERLAPMTWVTPRTTSITAVRFSPMW